MRVYSHRIPLRLDPPGTLSSDWGRHFSILAAGLACLALVACASAPPRVISITTIPRLSEGEGLLIIDIDSDIAIKRIAANRGVEAVNLAKGRHTWIVRVPAGNYRWNQFDFGYERGSAHLGWSDSGDEEFEFKVVAGKLNYPGEIIVRSNTALRSIGQGILVRNRNHSAMAVRALRNTYGPIIDAFPLHYSGSSGDGFLGYYTRERNKPHKAESISSSPIAIDAPDSGLSAETLFSTDGIHMVSVSPDGRWAVAHAQTGRKHGVLIQKLGSNRIRSVIANRSPLVSLFWIGPATFLASFNANGFIRSVVGRVREEGDEVEIRKIWIDAPGSLVDPLPLDGERVIWAFRWKGRSSVNRIRIDDLIAFKSKHSGSYDPSRTGKKLASIRSLEVHWIVDRKGFPRAALRRNEEGYSLLVRGASGGSFREIYEFRDGDEKNELWPQSLSADGEKLLVVAYNGHDTMGLVEFDMQTGRFGNTVFRREGADVTGVLLDFIDGELIAAVYEESGDRRFHYFDTATKKQMRNLRGLLAEDRVSVVGGSADRRAFVLFVSSGRNPGLFLLYDARTGHLVEIGHRYSRVDRDRLVEAEAIIAQSADGTEIESFLTVPSPSIRPRGIGAPLIVLPHGGPIGRRDTKQFDPIVQYLVSWGFAVLQVNYRGSSGYGLKFQDSGKQQWAQEIENDIDAAVEVAMARSDIDETRLCVLGGSYGGFSALASIVRHETRYRCVATINGVTDIPLMFETSDFADFDKVLERFSEVVGDVDEDREKLMGLSPVYDVAAMQVPVFVVYGTEDRRVDPDHAHRLLLMLEMYQKPHRSLEIRDGAHSPSQREWVILIRSLRRFLTKHLFAPDTFVPDPPLESSAFDIILDVGN